MATIITSSGDTLTMTVDGDRLLFLSTGMAEGIWVYVESSALWIKKVGDFLFVTSGEDVVIAYPTNTNTWLLDGTVEPTPPDPGPGTGEFSWPYEPTFGHWVTSEYGPRSGRFHEGMDFSGGPAVYGSDIPAIGDGTVTQSGLNGAFGYSCIIKHGTLDGNDYYSLYAHMPADPFVGVGAVVTKGQIIGHVNNSGSSFGSHLHMEIHKTSIGGGLKWDNLNPSYTSSRTPMNPRTFFNSYGDGTWILS